MAIAYSLPQSLLLNRLATWLAGHRRPPRLALPCPLRCQADGFDLEVTGVDLTAQGLELDTLHRLRPGARVVVAPPAELAGERPLAGWVRSCEVRVGGYHASLVFCRSEHSWAASALQQLGGQRRRDARIRADMLVKVRRWGGAVVDAVCCDVSRGGALLEVESPWPAEEPVTVLLGHVGVAAEVVETRGYCNDRWRVAVRFL